MGMLLAIDNVLETDTAIVATDVTIIVITIILCSSAASFLLPAGRPSYRGSRQSLHQLVALVSAIHPSCCMEKIAYLYSNQVELYL